MNSFGGVEQEVTGSSENSDSDLPDYTVSI
jgi:hypothetical protein